MGKKFVSLLCLILGIVTLTSTTSLGLSYDISAAGVIEEGVPGGDLATGSSDLEMPYENAGNPPSTEQIIGLRWVVPIGPGTKILKAHIEFTVDETKGGTAPVNLIIEGQLTLNAPGILDVTKNISSRAPWTKAQVQWAPENWVAVGAKSQTADIAAIIQEIIDQPGWAAGNALLVAIRDDKSKPSTGVRCAGTTAVLHLEVFNATAYAPNPANGAIGVFMPLLNWSKGDTAIFHNVYLGKTPELTEADLVASKSLVTMYYHVAGLDPGGQYYWRVDEVDLTDKITTGVVWSFVMQAQTAYYPIPTDGSVDVSPTGALTWQPGLAAMKHHLYLGASRDEVTQGAAGTDKGELTTTTFTPTGLDSVATYYWRVDELGLGGAVKTGAVWSFTTYLPVDDFESYTDDEGSRIYETWIDGWTNNTGSTVGNTTAPFAEQTIVRQGKQSMPLDYNNVKSPFYSEAEQEFAAAQNWTVGEVTDLRLDFRGEGRNGAGSLYVAMEDSAGKSAVVTHSNATAVTTTTWTQWKIPLSSFTGVNLAKVKKLYIGVGDRANPVAGGTGRLYIDDIRVTKP